MKLVEFLREFWIETRGECVGCKAVLKVFQAFARVEVSEDVARAAIDAGAAVEINEGEPPCDW